MYPLICKIGPVSIFSYGVMMAVAVVVCTFLMGKDARRLSIPSDTIFDFVFWVVLSGILGARVFFVLLNFDYFVALPAEIFMIQNGGISWQGGLIGGVLVGIIFIRIKKLPLWPTADLIAPYIALGQSIGRVGCFLNGCCYGREVSWGIYFPVHDAHLHPTQLYSTFGLLAIFFILKRYQKSAKVSGDVFILYLILAASMRFVIEFFRADHQIFAFGLSVFQVICLLILAAAGTVYLTRKNKV